MKLMKSMTAMAALSIAGIAFADIDNYENEIKWIHENTRYNTVVDSDYPDLKTVNVNFLVDTYGGADTRAVYDRNINTIFIASELEGELRTSVTIHELVHFYQYETEKYFQCAGSMEKEAYQAQFDYLKEVGMPYEYNVLSFKLITTCMGNKTF